MLYIVRHGQTDDNKYHIVQGNKSLNAVGKSQAKQVAHELKDYSFDICFCSPMVRTRQTWNEIKKFHKGLKVIFDERLVERKYGEWVGLCYDTEISDYKKIRWDANCILPDSVEKTLDFYNRVASFYDDIMSKYPNKNILIVAHSGIARMTYFHFVKKPTNYNYSDFYIGNCEILKI